MNGDMPLISPRAKEGMLIVGVEALPVAFVVFMVWAIVRR